MKKELTLSDIKLDTSNANKHTEYGMKLLEKSLQQLGAGRSILLDKDNNIICGNAVTETAAQIGLNKVKVVETTGDEIIAVKRTDLSITDKKAKELAIADNSIANKNLDWDFDVLNTNYDEVVLEDWGLDLDSLDTNIDKISIGDNDEDKNNAFATDINKIRNKLAYKLKEQKGYDLTAAFIESETLIIKKANECLID